MDHSIRVDKTRSFVNAFYTHYQGASVTKFHHEEKMRYIRCLLTLAFYVLDKHVYSENQKRFYCLSHTQNDIMDVELMTLNQRTTD